MMILYDCLLIQDAQRVGKILKSGGGAENWIRHIPYSNSVIVFVYGSYNQTYLLLAHNFLIVIIL